MMCCCIYTIVVTTALLLFLGNKSVVVNAQRASYPTRRFVPWDQNEARSAAETLGYTPSSWNNPGSNPIEKLTYEVMVVDRSVTVALAELDIDERSWDCYINHYRGYTWPELTNTYKNAYRALGWTHLSWNQMSDSPESDRFEWDMLNSEQQGAAETLCYFEELWDSIPLYQWNNKNSNSTVSLIPSGYPTSATVPSYSPSLIEEIKPSSNPLVTTTMPSMIKITGNPTSFEPSTPSSGPSTETYVQSSAPSRLTLSASVLPTMLPTTQLTIPFPYFRYVPWSKLNDDTRILATLLGYTQESWDLPGAASIEHMSYDRIKGSNTSKQIVYIQALGFGKPSWDCYITHYKSYDWEQLSEYGVQQHYETLGWTAQLWNNSDTSPTKGLPWNNLSIAERIAAESLCYLEPIWNNVTLTDEVAWRVSPSLLSSYSIKTFSWTTVISCSCIYIGLTQLHVFWW